MKTVLLLVSLLQALPFVRMNYEKLPDGKWMLGGGSEKPFGIGQTFGVELFDPATRSFSPLTILDRPRAYASAAALPASSP